ncbi:zf-TFIIB domain-containing protein [Curtobacterium sp. 9128]|uniref:TFIIB-type zinc ribbon-containing protein n=1 Tax=Curtobacterium sp. 9128 TaxID=1793722 RepID=UPI0011AAF27C|nr:zf-TFIIB domain-containing protein [Curtobacterium sp. 9128]
MQCPNDQSTLVMTDRSGIEIDYCPECRGVWLDRGELDKIIDRAAPATSGPIAPPMAAPAYGAVPGYTPGMAVPRNGYASPGSPGSPASWDAGRRRSDHGQPWSGQPWSGQPWSGQPGSGQQPHGRKRRGNWLSELFD